MPRGKKALILGQGRIAGAVAYYLKRNNPAWAVSYLSSEREVRNADILIGALAGALGEKGLSLALKYKVNLIDISDLDPPFYLRRKKEIEKAGITVIPGCGFSPGLVNFILGREFSRREGIKEIEIKAGSLSHRKLFFPFLWCFEDLALEHQIPSWQMCSGKKKKFPPFAGYEKEGFFGIEAESYYCASGFENILDKAKLKNFSCRVLRPLGFREFFGFLKNEGFLSKENQAFTKKVVEANAEDNITMAEITVRTKDQKIRWLIKACSKKNEALNSMQKITAASASAMCGLMASGGIKKSGLLFMEDMAKDGSLFSGFLQAVKRNNISLSCRVSAK